MSFLCTDRDPPSPAVTAAEARWAEHVQRADLTKETIYEIMHAEDPSTAITSRVQFVRIMAAFVSHYKQHLTRRVHSSGVTVLEIIIEAIRPARVELYLNNVRIRARFPGAHSYLLPV